MLYSIDTKNKITKMLDKLMKLFKVHFSSSLTLKDGTPLQLEGDLETGVQISVVTSDGNIPLPDGEYQMEDMTIITCKDGLVMDIVKPGEVEVPTEGLDPMGNPVPDELAAQKGNPDVSGLTPSVDETGTPTTTGTTADTSVSAADVPNEPVVDPNAPVEPDEEKIKIAELETKIASLEATIGDIMSKLNMISEKFSSATPLIKKKDNEGSSLINPKLQNKVDLINLLKKSRD